MFTIIAASVLISLIFAPLGCFVVWKRYVYFGDGLAHAGMLAAVIGTIIDVSVFYTGILISGIFAFAIFKLRNNAGNNAAISLTTSFMMSLSLVLASLSPESINITGYLIGDIILVTTQDLIILLLILILVWAFLISSWRGLVLTILSRDIAVSRGIKVKLLEQVFLLVLALSILSTIKIVGVLLATSIIVIPAMIARLVASSPLSMIIWAIIAGITMNASGVTFSWYLDIAFAPLMILCGGLVYLAAYLTRRMIHS